MGKKDGFWEETVEVLDFATSTTEAVSSVAEEWAGYDLSELTERSLACESGEIPFDGQRCGSVYVSTPGRCLVWLGSRIEKELELLVIDRSTGHLYTAKTSGQKEAHRISVVEIELTEPGYVDYIVSSNRNVGEFRVGVIVKE